MKGSNTHACTHTHIHTCMRAFPHTDNLCAFVVDNGLCLLVKEDGHRDGAVWVVLVCKAVHVMEVGKLWVERVWLLCCERPAAVWLGLKVHKPPESSDRNDILQPLECAHKQRSAQCQREVCECVCVCVCVSFSVLPCPRLSLATPTRSFACCVSALLVVRRTGGPMGSPRKSRDGSGPFRQGTWRSHRL